MGNNILLGAILVVIGSVYDEPIIGRSDNLQFVAKYCLHIFRCSKDVEMNGCHSFVFSSSLNQDAYIR